MKERFRDGSVYGKLMISVGIIVFIPTLTILFYPEESVYIIDFLIPSMGSVILGILLCMRKGKTGCNEDYLSLSQGSITVLFIWGYGIFMGAVPFVLSNQLSLIQALFESVSGFTTTGLSVMDVSVTPHIFLFHRSFMQFCGGLGFVLVTLIFMQGKQAMSLYSAEGHPDQLTPNIGKTARTIFQMYVMLLCVGIILYVMAGMGIFDSIIHTMSSLSTGGFSSKGNSIGDYNSAPIEFITILLMLIGATNFAVLSLIMKRKWKQVLKISEIRFTGLLLMIVIPLIACSLFGTVYTTLTESTRASIFNVVSALSTTGYATTTYDTWPQFSIGSLIVLMLIGGGIGSTAGGMKLTRVYLMLRMLKDNFKKRMVSSRSISKSYYYRAQGKTCMESSMILDTMGFITCYLIIFLIGSLLITCTANCTLGEAMFDFASSLGTVGLSIGLTGPNTDSLTLLVEMIGMMLGRLEIFIVFIGIHSLFSSCFEAFRIKVRIKR
ncbi:TrkH family potassium uptake protein [Lachnospiraceae bacterium LCP25S3_G4]